MRRYFIILTAGWMLPAAIILCINLLVDPYRIFHKPWIRDNYYLNNGMRIADSGIINTESFDSIILGTSMADNFSPAEASRIFGGKFVNLSLDGTSIAERSIVLNYALEKRKLNAVIYSLDWGTLDIASPVNTSIAPFAYLYDDSSLNDILIYANPKLLKYAYCGNIFVSSDSPCDDTKKDIENLTEWYSVQDAIKRFGGLHNWLENRNNVEIKNALTGIAKTIKSIDSGQVKAVDWTVVARETSMHQLVFRDYLLQYAAKYPEVKFYLFFPPYSRLNFALTEQGNPQAFETYLETLRFVVRESKKYDNVKIFGFETESFLDDIANYRDTIHYHQRINSEMLHWMNNGDHQLTTSNLDGYINEITARAAIYPLKDIGAQIDAYLSRDTQTAGMSSGR
jgi:hypothetical protein